MIEQITNRCVDFPSLSAKPYIETIIERNVRVIYTVKPGYTGCSEYAGGPPSEPSVGPQVEIEKVLVESEGGWTEMEPTLEERNEFIDRVLEEL